MAKLRVGHGFDVHRLVPSRRLVVGGVVIPFEMGLDGHSDADVLLHAVMDALLGAVGLPDIGQHFPPSDIRYKDVSSLDLLTQVRVLIERAGCEEIDNIDAIVMAERPQLNPYIPQMKKAIATVLGIKESDINIKATTTERLGFVGREEGMAASAVCLVACHG